MAISVSVSQPEALTESTSNAFLDITFSNSEAYTYAANSTVYFYALLTDSTSGTPKTLEVTFELPVTTSKTIDANTPQNFVFENTTNLVPTVTGSNGRICYLPA